MGQPKGTELYTVGQPHYAGWLCVGQPKGTGASLEQDMKLPACSPATPHCARLRRLLAWNARSPATPARLERLLACNAAPRSPGPPARLQRRTAHLHVGCLGPNLSRLVVSGPTARLQRLLAWNAWSPATPHRARPDRLLACNAALRTCMSWFSHFTARAIRTTGSWLTHFTARAITKKSFD